MTRADMREVLVTGDFDDIRSSHVRFLQEASRWGRLHVLAWSDEALRQMGRKTPKFPQDERLYFLRSLRYVDECTVIDAAADSNGIPLAYARPQAIWAVADEENTRQRRAFCKSHGMGLRVVDHLLIAGFPATDEERVTPGSAGSRVLVTGCYDWLHSGHIRFFEEASRFGELHVVVGHDANIRLLKGDRHPMIPQEERRYMVGSIRFVRSARISSGRGWMDAAPEITLLKPEIYIVNEDGDNEEKRRFCREQGLRYIVLSRVPKEGLPRRQSKDLRGF